MKRPTIRSLLLAVPLLAASPAWAEWTPAFTASPQATWNEADAPLPTGLPDAIGGKALRQPLTVAWQGTAVRLVLSNRNGKDSLPIDGVTIARSAGGAKIDREAMPVTVGGSGAFAILPGTTVLSDPVAFPVGRGDRLAVTIRYGAKAKVEDFHWDARETGYIIPGNAADNKSPQVLEKVTVRATLAGVFVDGEAPTTVVTIGDSITDGNGAPIDRMARWPDYLARAMADRGIAVVNAGISGNRLLSPGMGDAVLARLDEDVFAVPGIDTVVMLIGTNDIAWPGSPFAPDEQPMTLSRLQAGFRQVAARAETHGVRLVVGTIPPFRGALPDTPMAATYWSAEKDALRQQFNRWLRDSGEFATVVDFDAALRDPSDPQKLAAKADSGDHLHPGAEGNAIMARAITYQDLTGDKQ